MAAARGRQLSLVLPNAVRRAVNILDSAEHLRAALAFAYLLTVFAGIARRGRLGLEPRPDALGVLLLLLGLGLLLLFLYPITGDIASRRPATKQLSLASFDSLSPLNLSTPLKDFTSRAIAIS